MTKPVLGVLLLAIGACGGSAGDEPPDAQLGPLEDAAIIPDAIEEPTPDAMPFDTGITLTKIGNPLWETTGWQVFSGPSFASTVQQVWSPGHDYHASANSFGPGDVHAPPYDTEIADRLTALGYTPGFAFDVADWTYPTGLIFLGAIIPSTGAPTGSTSDYADGPMIPGAQQFIVDGEVAREGIVVDPDFDSTYPTLAQIDPTLSVDGWSHMTLSFGEDTSYIPGTPGNYVFRVRVTETPNTANAWLVEIRFTVAPN